MNHEIASLRNNQDTVIQMESERCLFAAHILEDSKPTWDLENNTLR